MGTAQSSCQAHFAMPLLFSQRKPAPPKHALHLAPKSFPCLMCATDTRDLAMVAPAKLLNSSNKLAASPRHQVHCRCQPTPGMHDLQISGTGPWWQLPDWPQSACWRTEQRYAPLPRPPAASLPPLTPSWARRCGWPYQDFCRGLPSCVVWGCCCRYHPKALPLEATHCSTMWSGRDSHLPSFLRQGCTCKKVSLLARPILTCCS